AGRRDRPGGRAGGRRARAASPAAAAAAAAAAAPAGGGGGAPAGRVAALPALVARLLTGRPVLGTVPGREHPATAEAVLHARHRIGELQRPRQQLQRPPEVTGRDGR